MYKGAASNDRRAVLFRLLRPPEAPGLGCHPNPTIHHLINASSLCTQLPVHPAGSNARPFNLMPFSHPGPTSHAYHGLQPSWLTCRPPKPSPPTTNPCIHHPSNPPHLLADRVCLRSQLLQLLLHRRQLRLQLRHARMQRLQLAQLSHLYICLGGQTLQDGWPIRPY